MRNKEEKTCADCRFCIEDCRSHTYIRRGYYFCKKKGSFFSRNYRIGEGTRIDRNSPACKWFEEKELL